MIGHANKYPVIEVLRGHRRPLDEIHAANFEELDEDDELSADSDALSGTN